MCCADLVVAVMTCLGGRRRQTAQQTPTTLIIREQDCLGQKCSPRGERAVQTNAAGPGVHVYESFRNFEHPVAILDCA